MKRSLALSVSFVFVLLMFVGSSGASAMDQSPAPNLPRVDRCDLKGARGPCEEACLPPRGLRIRRIEPVNELYAEISVELPKAWETQEFQVQLDGREINARPLGGGFSEDRRVASLLFFPGRTGMKRVSVRATIDGKEIEATQSFTWAGRPFIALLSYVGEKTLAGAAEKPRLVTANVDSLTIKLNGEPVDFDTIGQDAKLLSIRPRWRAGINTISTDGKGTDGSRVSRSYTFYDAAGGIAQGQMALFKYGTLGSKSGPFYSLVIQGDAIALGADRTVECFTVSDDGWVGKEIMLVRELRAVKPGRATVQIFEKPHFLEQKRLKEEVTITVTPAGR